MGTQPLETEVDARLPLSRATLTATISMTGRAAQLVGRGMSSGRTGEADKRAAESPLGLLGR
jgi:hypothetical protein